MLYMLLSERAFDFSSCDFLPRPEIDRPCPRYIRGDYVYQHPFRFSLWNLVVNLIGTSVAGKVKASWLSAEVGCACMKYRLLAKRLLFPCLVKLGHVGRWGYMCCIFYMYV